MDQVAISNLAWPAQEVREAVALCARLGFTGLEIAPARTFPDWPQPPRDLERLRAELADSGLAIIGLQSILFGVRGVELFASGVTRARLSDHLRMIARVAGSLGAQVCVFGAPRNRDPGLITPAEARKIAVDFFSSIAPAFEAEGTCLTLEPNHSSYGCRFVTQTAQAIDLVKEIGRSGFRVQIDTGMAFLGNEHPSIISEAVGVAGHAHVSEPQLRPLGTANSDHATVSAALRSGGYQGWLSVEMQETVDWRSNIKRAAKLMTTAYRPASCLGTDY
jgi:D-psicose/D-tagatose/L-ribulose 3-epimerase